MDVGRLKSHQNIYRCLGERLYEPEATILFVFVVYPPIRLNITSHRQRNVKDFGDEIRLGSNAWVGLGSRCHIP